MAFSMFIAAARRQDLLAFGNDMVGADHGADTDQQGRAQRPGAIAVEQRLRRRRIATAGRCDETVGEGRAGVAPDQDEAPRAQPAMVGRPQAEIEDQLEVASTRGRVLEGTDRATAEQEIERMPAIFGVSRSIVRGALGD